MPESNPPSNPGSHDRPVTDPRSIQPAPEASALEDQALEAAMAREMGHPDPAPDPEIPLKRMWDAELESELAAALSGFDPQSMEVARPRPKLEGRLPVAKGERGQEARQGPRRGKVIGVRGKSVFVDLGGKSEGVLPIDLFAGEIPHPGSEIEVIVDRFDPDEGIHLLRLKGSAIDANWENLRKGVVVEARITRTVKGGVEVDVNGLRGFMPISQLDLNRVEDGSEYLNQKVRAIVTEVNPRERNLVVSRRELLEQERAELREKTWATLEEGQVREGIVRSVKPFGAFVDLGGVDGLLPIGEMSWSRVQNVEDLVRVGDQVQVKVIRIDRTNRKLTLGLKQLSPSPWEKVEEKYPRGAMVRGKVTKILEFGAFVELEPGVEGLIHVSELSPTRVRRVSDLVQPDQEVEVRVLKVEPANRRISLSLLPAVKGPPSDAEKDEDDSEHDQAPPPPEPPRKTPLKGGLGDRDFHRR
jgi:ribosomal protein S1